MQRVLHTFTRCRLSLGRDVGHVCLMLCGGGALRDPTSTRLFNERAPTMVL